MRIFFFAFIYMVVGSWMNLVFNSYFQIGGLKLNWILLFILVLSFRHSNLSLYIVAILAGLICDAHSHGIMGLYGSSFFIIILVVNQVKKILYSNSFLSISLTIIGITILEGWISLSILSMFEPDIEKTFFMLNKILLLSLLHGLISPIVILLIIWSERMFLKEY